MAPMVRLDNLVNEELIRDIPREENKQEVATDNSEVKQDMFTPGLENIENDPNGSSGEEAIEEARPEQKRLLCSTRISRPTEFYGEDTP